MGIPFAEAGFPEVAARVLYRVVERKYRQTRYKEMSGPEILILVLDDLRFFQGATIYSCALAALFALRKGQKLRKWRDTAVLHSRAGLGFRRCWYDDYKANRR